MSLPVQCIWLTPCLVARATISHFIIRLNSPWSFVFQQTAIKAVVRSYRYWLTRDERDIKAFRTRRSGLSSREYDERWSLKRRQRNDLCIKRWLRRITAFGSSKQ